MKSAFGNTCFDNRSFQKSRLSNELDSWRLGIKFMDNIIYIPVNKTLFPADLLCYLGHVSVYACHLTVRDLVTIFYHVIA
jgi:hypothetical protein